MRTTLRKLTSLVVVVMLLIGLVPTSMFAEPPQANAKVVLQQTRPEPLIFELKPHDWVHGATEQRFTTADGESPPLVSIDSVNATYTILVKSIVSGQEVLLFAEEINVPEAGNVNYSPDAKLDAMYPSNVNPIIRMDYPRQKGWGCQVIENDTDIIADSLPADNTIPETELDVPIGTYKLRLYEKDEKTGTIYTLKEWNNIVIDSIFTYVATVHLGAFDTNTLTFPHKSKILTQYVGGEQLSYTLTRAGGEVVGTWTANTGAPTDATASPYLFPDTYELKISRIETGVLTQVATKSIELNQAGVELPVDIDDAINGGGTGNPPPTIIPQGSTVFKIAVDAENTNKVYAKLYRSEHSGNTLIGTLDDTNHFTSGAQNSSNEYYIEVYNKSGGADEIIKTYVVNDEGHPPVDGGITELTDLNAYITKLGGLNGPLDNDLKYVEVFLIKSSFYDNESDTLLAGVTFTIQDTATSNFVNDPNTGQPVEIKHTAFERLSDNPDGIRVHGLELGKSYQLVPLNPSAYEDITAQTRAYKSRFSNMDIYPREYQYQHTGSVLYPVPEIKSFQISRYDEANKVLFARMEMGAIYPESIRNATPAHESTSFVFQADLVNANAPHASYLLSLMHRPYLVHHLRTDFPAYVPGKHKEIAEHSVVNLVLPVNDDFVAAYTNNGNQIPEVALDVTISESSSADIGGGTPIANIRKPVEPVPDTASMNIQLVDRSSLAHIAGIKLLPLIKRMPGGAGGGGFLPPSNNGRGGIPMHNNPIPLDNMPITDANTILSEDTETSFEYAASFESALRADKAKVYVYQEKVPDGYLRPNVGLIPLTDAGFTSYIGSFIGTNRDIDEGDGSMNRITVYNEPIVAVTTQLDPPEHITPTNQTILTIDANFEKLVPSYYYRVNIEGKSEDGTTSLGVSENHDFTATGRTHTINDMSLQLPTRGKYKLITKIYRSKTNTPLTYEEVGKKEEIVTIAPPTAPPTTGSEPITVRAINADYKAGSSDTQHIAGVKFGVYRGEPGQGTPYTQAQTPLILETNSTGEVVLQGLPQGKYYLVGLDSASVDTLTKTATDPVKAFMFDRHMQNDTHNNLGIEVLANKKVADVLGQEITELNVYLHKTPHISGDVKNKTKSKITIRSHVTIPGDIVRGEYDAFLLTGQINHKNSIAIGNLPPSAIEIDTNSMRLYLDDIRVGNSVKNIQGNDLAFSISLNNNIEAARSRYVGQAAYQGGPSRSNRMLVGLAGKSKLTLEFDVAIDESKLGNGKYLFDTALALEFTKKGGSPRNVHAAVPFEVTKGSTTPSTPTPDTPKDTPKDTPTDSPKDKPIDKPKDTPKDTPKPDVKVPTIIVNTTIVDKMTGLDVVLAEGDKTLLATVEYKGLEVGKEYSVEITAQDGIGRAQKLTPTTENGTVDIEIPFNAGKYSGQKLEFATVIMHGATELANTSGDYIWLPYNTTTVQEKIVPFTHTKVADMIAYKKLKSGETYRVEGAIIDKNSDEVVATAVHEFRANAEDMSIDITFDLDATHLRGRDLVVFETTKLRGYDIAIHADKNSESQSFSVATGITDKPNTGVDSTNNVVLLLVGVLGIGLGLGGASYLILQRKRQSK